MERVTVNVVTVASIAVRTQLLVCSLLYIIQYTTADALSMAK